MSTQAKVGIGVGALGVATIALGSYFGLRAMSKWDEAQDHCVDSACDASGVDLHDTAQTSGNVSTALFAVGAAGEGGERVAVRFVGVAADLFGCDCPCDARGGRVALGPP